MCFLQKTALNLVKCGLHSPTYYFLPHIGGPHPVLYFTIQATEKYSNSNVLGGSLATVDSQQEQDALSALIPTSISSLPSTGGVWIGLSDILREGTFDTWRDDSPVREYGDRNLFLLFPLDFR